MLKPHETCLRCKNQLKLTKLPYQEKNVKTNQNYILRKEGLQFQNSGKSKRR